MATTIWMMRFMINLCLKIKPTADGDTFGSGQGV
nr:MAG TPA: hypothetical protein [Caudoviricetes sp.]